jgi:hypothetical protein
VISRRTAVLHPPKPAPQVVDMGRDLHVAEGRRSSADHYCPSRSDESEEWLLIGQGSMVFDRPRTDIHRFGEVTQSIFKCKRSSWVANVKTGTAMMKRLADFLLTLPQGGLTESRRGEAYA